MSERALQLEKTEHIPKPKRNSFWIVGCLGLPGAGSQIIGVDNQELTAHVDMKPAGSLVFPRGMITASITPATQSPERNGALNTPAIPEREERPCTHSPETRAAPGSRGVCCGLS